jgi:hypothetical protein
MAAQMAAMLSGWGLPLASALSAARWLMGRHCPYCEIATEFLKLLEQGKVDQDKVRSLLVDVLNAKEQKDERRLEALKGKLEALRTST